MHRQNGAYASLSHFTSITCMNACIISYFFLFCFLFFYSRCVSVCLCDLNRRIVEMENTHNFVTAKIVDLLKSFAWQHRQSTEMSQLEIRIDSSRRCTNVCVCFVRISQTKFPFYRESKKKSSTFSYKEAFVQNNV